MARRTRRGDSGPNTWAGFVDALSTLLMVMIFALVVFMLAQFFLNVALTGRNEALAKLQDKVAQLADTLSLERTNNADLRVQLAQLSADLQSATSARDQAAQALAQLKIQRDNLAAQLQASQTKETDAASKLSDAQARIGLLQSDLDKAMKEVSVGQDTIEMKLGEIASLQRDLDALKQARTDLENKVDHLAVLLKLAKENESKTTSQLTQSQAQIAANKKTIDKMIAELTAARDRSKELTAKLSSAEERTALAQKQIDKRDIRISELVQAVTMSQKERDQAKKISDQRLAQIELLNQQLAALRQQIAALNTALDASEAKTKADKVQIADLGKRLNAALAAKVQELTKYRSEFFEKLVKVLGDKPGIKIVGDRFVLQSELLFPSGSADISDAGHRQLDKVAKLVIQLSHEIPSNVNWIMRVDGYTDIVPIHTTQFPSNWELSTARATAVVRYLIAQGVPPDRLAATGFGQYQPIDPGTSPEALRRNRRIEFKLTDR